MQASPPGALLGLETSGRRKATASGKLPRRAPKWCPRPLGQTPRPTDRKQPRPAWSPPAGGPRRVLPPNRPRAGVAAHPALGRPGLRRAAPASSAGCGSRAPGPSAGSRGPRGRLAAERPAGWSILAAAACGRGRVPLGSARPRRPACLPAPRSPPRPLSAPAARPAARGGRGRGAGGGAGRMPPRAPPPRPSARPSEARPGAGVCLSACSGSAVPPAPAEARRLPRPPPPRGRSRPREGRASRCRLGSVHTADPAFKPPGDHPGPELRGPGTKWPGVGGSGRPPGGRHT